MPDIFDCIIIGGGPAGLSAAIYTGRFRRKTLVLDRGGSRAALIPISHNVPGFPGGIGGKQLLARLRVQAETYGAEYRSGDVTGVQRSGPDWSVQGNEIDLVGRTILFATGVDDRQLDLSDEEHEAALAAGKLRYCPVCDGYEAGGPASDARIGVIGADRHGVAEALFLHRYSRNVILFTDKTCDLGVKDHEMLRDAGIAWDPRPVKRYDFSGDGVRLELEGTGHAQVDTIYPALGSEPNIELLKQLGISVDEDNCVPTDRHQSLSFKGLYAAGDLVSGLDQISVALGHAAIAATEMHNYLRERDGETPDA